MVLVVFIRVHSGHQKYQYVRSIRATYHNKSHEFHNGDTFFIMSNFNFYISSKYHYYIFHYVISKYCQICKKKYFEILVQKVLIMRGFWRSLKITPESAIWITVLIYLDVTLTPHVDGAEFWISCMVYTSFSQ